MTEKRGQKASAIDWIMRAVVALLLPLLGVNTNTQATMNARIGVLMERQEHQARVDEDRATHEARIVAIETSRFTGADAQAMRAHYDAQLLDLWKELQESLKDVREDQKELREGLVAIMDKLEARIRAIENGK